MTMKGLIRLALGAAAGYSIGRALEAKAQGVPLAEAFSLKNGVAGLLTPVAKLPLQPAALDVSPRAS
jgi:hypothetical protein